MHENGVVKMDTDEFYREYIGRCRLKKGDIVDITSDLRKMLLFFQKRGGRFDANKLIDQLQEAVGEEGTLLIRTFNWDFCHGVPFDRAQTPSKVGSLGNVALKRPDFVRTKHALYSWCVWGKEQAYLTQIDPVDSFGDDSIFAWLENSGAIGLRLGNTYGPGITCLHRAEQRAGLPYRYIKQFTGSYIDYSGPIGEKTYSMFVRNLEYDFKIITEGLDERLRGLGLQETFCYEGIQINKQNLEALGDKMYRDILSGKWSDWVLCTKIDEPDRH